MAPSLYPLPITLFGEWHLFCHTVQVVHVNITSTRPPGPKVSQQSKEMIFVTEFHFFMLWLMDVNVAKRMREVERGGSWENNLPFYACPPYTYTAIIDKKFDGMTVQTSLSDDAPVQWIQ